MTDRALRKLYMEAVVTTSNSVGHEEVSDWLLTLCIVVFTELVDEARGSDFEGVG